MQFDSDLFINKIWCGAVSSYKEGYRAISYFNTLVRSGKIVAPSNKHIHILEYHILNKHRINNDLNLTVQLALNINKSQLQDFHNAFVGNGLDKDISLFNGVGGAIRKYHYAIEHHDIKAIKQINKKYLPKFMVNLYNL